MKSYIEYMENYGFVIAGFVVGLTVGLTGVGGGSLMTPLLIFFFGIKPYLAVGTDLLFAAFTKAGGTFSLSQRGMVPWRPVASLCAGSIPAALITVLILHKVGPSTPEVQRVMTSSLGIALLLTACAMFYKAIRGKQLQPATTAVDLIEAAKPRHWLLPILFGALIGSLVTLTSVGAGAIGVTVLMILYPRLPLASIIAADIAYAVPLTMIAGIGHASLGSVDGYLLASLLAGSLPGIWLGSRLAHKAPDRLIRGLISLILAWVSTKLVFA